MHRITWGLGIILGVIAAALTLTTALAADDAPAVGDGTAATTTVADEVGGPATETRFGLADLLNRDGPLPALDERLGLEVDTLVALQPGIEERVGLGRDVDNRLGLNLGELVGFAQDAEDGFDLGNLGDLGDQLNLENLVTLGTLPVPATPAETPRTPVDLSSNPELTDVVDLRDLVDAGETVDSVAPVVDSAPVAPAVDSGAPVTPVTPVTPVERRLVADDGSINLSNLIRDRAGEGELVDVANLVSLSQPVTVTGDGGSASTEATDSSATTQVDPSDGDPGTIGAVERDPLVAGDGLGLSGVLATVAGIPTTAPAPVLNGKIHLGDIVKLRDIVTDDETTVESARLDPNGGSEAIALTDGPPGGAGVVDVDDLLDDGDGRIAGATDVGDLLRGRDDGSGGRRLVLTHLLALSDRLGTGG